MIYYLYLLGAIILEILGTNFMKMSNGFSKLGFSLATLVTYAVCYYLFSLSLKGIKLNVAYATWGGVGIVLVTALSFFVFHEHTSWLQIFGILLVVIGVVITNLSGNH